MYISDENRVEVQGRGFDAFGCFERYLFFSCLSCFLLLSPIFLFLLNTYASLYQNSFITLRQHRRFIVHQNTQSTINPNSLARHHQDFSLLSFFSSPHIRSAIPELIYYAPPRYTTKTPLLRLARPHLFSIDENILFIIGKNTLSTIGHLLAQMAHQVSNMSENPAGFNLEYTLYSFDGAPHSRIVTIVDLATPFSEEEINSFRAEHNETILACINSLGPPPTEMTPAEYVDWAFQQVAEPFPGVYMTIEMMAASLSTDMEDRMNAFNVEYALHNMQIISGQRPQRPQQTNAPQWHLTGVQRIAVDCRDNKYESYQCSDRHWRLLQGEALESAKRRTANLQAPIRPLIPRPALQTPVDNKQSGNASEQTAPFQ
jgi:hypothetical protein